MIYRKPALGHAGDGGSSTSTARTQKGIFLASAAGFRIHTEEFKNLKLYLKFSRRSDLFDQRLGNSRKYYEKSD